MEITTKLLFLIWEYYGFWEVKEKNIFAECHTLRKFFNRKRIIQYTRSIQNVVFFVKMS